MNPCDAMPKDYGMYYEGCWMYHNTHGIGRVSTIAGSKSMWLDTTEGMEPPKKVKASALMCWWPRAGAFNVPNEAVYIARRAIRNMRKSAVGQDHYFVKWGSPYAQEVMYTLKTGPNYVTLPEAVRQLSHSVRSAVAISRDVIVHFEDESKDNETLTVVFRGMEAGRIINGRYEPAFHDHPLTGRVLRQLEGQL